MQEATLANPEDGKQLEALATTLPRTMADIEFALYMLMAHLRGLERTEREGKIHNILAPAFVDIPKSMNFPVDSAAYMLMLQTMLTQPMGMQQGINNWLIQAANHKLGALITESTKVTGLEADRADALIQILIDGLSDPDAAKTPVGTAAIVTAKINTLARRDC